jgi:HAD superfamily hydrolase (TIGR01509 family)
VGRDAAGFRAEDRPSAPGLRRRARAALRSDREALRRPTPTPPDLRAVLFDWDGTLLDSAESSFFCYERLFSELGIAFTRETFARTYSPDWYRTYEALGLARSRWPEADARWLEIYAGERCELFPQASTAVHRLRNGGVAVGLVTGGSRARIERELASLGVSALFDTVVCSEDADRKKPDPEALRVALERLRVDAPRAAYVGDSPEDVEMARSAGVFSVAIAGRFPNREALVRAGPDLFARDLVEALERLMGIMN